MQTSLPKDRVLNFWKIDYRVKCIKVITRSMYNGWILTGKLGAQNYLANPHFDDAYNFFYWKTLVIFEPNIKLEFPLRGSSANRKLNFSIIYRIKIKSNSSVQMSSLNSKADTDTREKSKTIFSATYLHIVPFVIYTRLPKQPWPKTTGFVKKICNWVSILNKRFQTSKVYNTISIYTGPKYTSYYIKYEQFE